MTRLPYLFCFAFWLVFAWLLFSKQANRQLFWTLMWLLLTCAYTAIALRRAWYDFSRHPWVTLNATFSLPTGKTKVLCEIHSQFRVKVQVKVKCKSCSAADALPVRIVRPDGKLILEEMFIPAFGAFHYQAVISSSDLPASITLTNATKTEQSFFSKIKYSEMVAKHETCADAPK